MTEKCKQIKYGSVDMHRTRTAVQSSGRTIRVRP
jgi:hypothetical protein